MLDKSSKRRDAEHSGSDRSLEEGRNANVVAGLDNSDGDSHCLIAKVDFKLIRRGEVGETHNKVGSPEGSAPRPDLAPPSPGPRGTRCFKDDPGDTATFDPAKDGVDDLPGDRSAVRQKFQN